MDAQRYLKILVPQIPLLFPRSVSEIYENMALIETEVKRLIQREADIDMYLFCECCIDNIGVENVTEFMAPKVLQDIEDFWKGIATLTGTYVTAGHIGKDDKGWRNYATCFSSDGEIVARYAKSHLYFEERDFFTPGDDPMVFDFKGWKVSMLICADFCSPEFARIMVSRGCELFLAPSSWIYPHDELWILSNRMRAAENAAYLVSANHRGKLPEGQIKLGNAMAVNPHGEIIASMGTQETGYFTAVLDKELIQQAREELPWLEWRRPELYKKLL